MEKKKFKELYSLEDRKNLFDTWSRRYDKKIFVVAETFNNEQLPFFSEIFKIEPNATVHKLVKLIRNRMKLEEQVAIYIYCNKVIVPPTNIMQSVYERHKDGDGILYLNIVSIDAFGNP